MPALDDLVRALVREAVRDELAAQLASVIAGLNAVASGAAVGPVSLDSAALALGKPVRTLRRLARLGQLPGAIRLGRSWRVDLAALKAAGSDDQIAALAAEARR